MFLRSWRVECHAVELHQSALDPLIAKVPRVIIRQRDERDADTLQEVQHSWGRSLHPSARWVSHSQSRQSRQSRQGQSQPGR